MRKTHKIKMMALALGLGMTAMMAGNTAADAPCEKQCQVEYEQCKVFCSKNPCFVACETSYGFCLDNCGSES